MNFYQFLNISGACLIFFSNLFNFMLPLGQSGFGWECHLGRKSERFCVTGPWKVWDLSWDGICFYCIIYLCHSNLFMPYWSTCPSLFISVIWYWWDEFLVFFHCCCCTRIMLLIHGLSGNCHSPTQPQHELELDLIMGRLTHPPGTLRPLPDNLGSWFSLNVKCVKKSKTFTKVVKCTVYLANVSWFSSHHQSLMVQTMTEG